MFIKPQQTLYRGKSFKCTLYMVMYLLILMTQSVYGLYEGMYCGTESCYDVLGVSRDDSKADISKAYRKLARQWHPDMHQGDEAKLEAEKQFQRIATAYEILRDSDQKKDYDYLLDNPDEFYWNYYQYYYRRVTPKVDVRIVIVVTITVISVCQYYVAWTNYNSAIDYFTTVPKYRIQAKEIAVKEKLLETDKKKLRGKTKAEIKDDEEKVLRSVIRDKMDIRGGYRLPHWTDVLWVQLVILPYTIAVYVKWYARWIWKFSINKEEYGDEEKLYLIRKNMGCSAAKWEEVEDEQKEDYLNDELWKKDKFIIWKAERDAEVKAKLAESARYKSIRRYLKNNKQQMTFGPE